MRPEWGHQGKISQRDGKRGKGRGRVGKREGRERERSRTQTCSVSSWIPQISTLNKGLDKALPSQEEALESGLASQLLFLPLPSSTPHY